MHSFELGTRYDSIETAAVSPTFVYLLFIPAGLMKSFLTWRTEPAWLHVFPIAAVPLVQIFASEGTIRLLFPLADGDSSKAATHVRVHST